MATKIRIGALISGGGTNLQAIIDACAAGRIAGEVVFVGSDRPGASGLQRAAQHGIPAFLVDYGAIVRQYREQPDTLKLPADFDLEDLKKKQNLFGAGVEPQKVSAFLITRAVAEARLLAQMAPFNPDLLVLAGFMRNFSPYFIDRFNVAPDEPRIMNIHPALLPAFAGVDGYGDTFRYGCKVGGCTVHFVDYGEDSGPVIGQRCFPITEDDDLESIKSKGLALEWELYPQCIQWFAQKRLQTVMMTHVLDSGQPPVRRRVVKIAQCLRADTK
jgi:phosphoribosylglycinamide formyltransferase 1